MPTRWAAPTRERTRRLCCGDSDRLMEALLLGRDGVLVKESSQSIDTSDPRTVIETALGNIRDGSLEIDATMRSCFVVVLDKLAKRPLKVTLVADEEPVEALGRAVRTNRSANAFARGARTGVLMTWAPTDFSISSKGPTNFVSRSRIKKLTMRPSSSSKTVRLRACSVTQFPIGCSVTPGKKTLRRSRSMKNNT